MKYLKGSRFGLYQDLLRSSRYFKLVCGAGNEDVIHHYEITKSSGNTSSAGPADYSHKVEVNSDEDDASSVSNREYEERIQDKKRQIKLLNKSFLPEFIEEFDILIRQ